MKLPGILALLGCFTWAMADGQPGLVKIRVDTQVMSRIAPGFTGLGYETSAVAQAGYFSAGNTRLVNIYRNLGSRGLIRVGGNVSDHTKYVPEGVSAARTERKTTIINRADLARLAGFARAAGWRVMWGLNLGTGTEQEAAQEAKAVAAALGDHLQSFQIGNEVDLQHLYNRKYHGFAAYYADYLRYKAAVRSALPDAVFSGPDVAGNMDWLRAFAAKEGGDIRLLTHHYYRTGAGRPDATIETLLHEDVAWQKKLQQLQRISRQTRVPFRINEVNSFYGGGKAGVSDVFGSALWCLDYMFTLASYGCNGVNMETDINQLGWISHYSPVVHDSAGNVGVRPEYYGMLAFAQAGHGALLKLSMDRAGVNLTAYAARSNGEHAGLWVTLVNKDLSRDAEAEIMLPDESYTEATVYRLEAPSVTSKDHVTLAGAAVSADGRWRPGSLEKIAVENGTARVRAPHASAVLVRFSAAANQADHGK